MSSENRGGSKISSVQCFDPRESERTFGRKCSCLVQRSNVDRQSKSFLDLSKAILLFSIGIKCPWSMSLTNSNRVADQCVSMNNGRISTTNFVFIRSRRQKEYFHLEGHFPLFGIDSFSSSRKHFFAWTNARNSNQKFQIMFLLTKRKNGIPSTMIFSPSVEWTARISFSPNTFRRIPLSWSSSNERNFSVVENLFLLFRRRSFPAVDRTKWLFPISPLGTFRLTAVQSSSKMNIQLPNFIEWIWSSKRMKIWTQFFSDIEKEIRSDERRTRRTAKPTSLVSIRFSIKQTHLMNQRMDVWPVSLRGKNLRSAVDAYFHFLSSTDDRDEDEANTCSSWIVFLILHFFLFARLKKRRLISIGFFLSPRVVDLTLFWTLEFVEKSDFKANYM